MVTHIMCLVREKLTFTEGTGPCWFFCDNITTQRRKYNSMCQVAKPMSHAEVICAKENLFLVCCWMLTITRNENGDVCVFLCWTFLQFSSNILTSIKVWTKGRYVYCAVLIETFCSHLLYSHGHTSISWSQKQKNRWGLWKRADEPADS